MCGEDKSHIGPLLAYCSQLCKQRMDEDLQKYDVTRMQAHVILYLLRAETKGEVNQKDLEKHVRIKAPTVNGIVERLEEKGMLKRVSGSRDGRCRCLTVTEKGRRMQQEIDRSIRESEALMAQGFTPEERQQFRAFLERMIENLKGGENG